MSSDAKQKQEVIGMVERVARAIMAECQNMGALAHRVSGNQAIERRLARAAIEAMREPTDAMDEAGQNIANKAYLDPEELPADAHFVWQAMIDAALNEQVAG